MRRRVFPRPPLAVGAHAPAPRTPAWGRARTGLREVLAEAALYACGSPRSRLHGRAALRELDARLRRDIGLSANAPDVVPSATGFEGYR